MYSGKRVINGTFGFVWIDGTFVCECYGLKAVSKFSKEAVNLCGIMEEDNKVTKIQNTGNLKLHKIDSRMAILIADKISNGNDVRFTIVSKLADPDAYGSERVTLTNVSFDDLTIADWEAAKKGVIETAFTFGKFKFIDKIKPR